jgi:hypothetical protein
MPHPVTALPLHQQRQLRLPNVLFSSRRRYRRQPAASQTRLPDWVWGAGLGVIVLIFVVGFFLFSRITASGSTCDDPLKPILNVATQSNDAAGFQQEDVDLNRLVTFIQNGDINGANAIFYGAPHNFMHTAEPEIRAKNETLGKNLCKAVIKFETDFDTTQSGITTSQLANEVIVVRDYLRDGAVALGYPRPGS